MLYRRLSETLIGHQAGGSCKPMSRWHMLTKPPKAQQSGVYPVEARTTCLLHDMSEQDGHRSAASGGHARKWHVQGDKFIAGGCWSSESLFELEFVRDRKPHREN